MFNQSGIIMSVENNPVVNLNELSISALSARLSYAPNSEKEGLLNILIPHLKETQPYSQDASLQAQAAVEPEIVEKVEEGKEVKPPKIFIIPPPKNKPVTLASGSLSESALNLIKKFVEGAKRYLNEWKSDSNCLQKVMSLYLNAVVFHNNWLNLLSEDKRKAENAIREIIGVIEDLYGLNSVKNEAVYFLTKKYLEGNFGLELPSSLSKSSSAYESSGLGEEFQPTTVDDREIVEPSAPPLPESMEALDAIRQSLDDARQHLMINGYMQLYCYEAKIKFFDTTTSFGRYWSQLDEKDIEAAKKMVEEFAQFISVDTARPPDSDCRQYAKDIIVKFLKDNEYLREDFEAVWPSAAASEESSASSPFTEESSEKRLFVPFQNSSVSRFKLFGGHSNFAAVDLSSWDGKIASINNDCAKIIAKTALDLLKSQTRNLLGGLDNTNTLKRDLLSTLLTYLDPDITHNSLNAKKYSPYWFKQMCHLLMREVSEKNSLDKNQLLEIVMTGRTANLLNYLNQAMSDEGQAQIISMNESSAVLPLNRK